MSEFRPTKMFLEKAKHWAFQNEKRCRYCKTREWRPFLPRVSSIAAQLETPLLIYLVLLLPLIMSISSNYSRVKIKMCEM